MKRKGFTLIELLAVIVILAIIALIAVPLVLNVIEESKRGAAKESATNYVKQVESVLVKSLMDGSSIVTTGLYTLDSNGNIESPITLEVPMKGDKAKEGSVCVGEKGSVTSYFLKVGNYYVTSSDGTTQEITNDKVELECVIVEEKDLVYANGTAVYFNPETNQKCSEEEYQSNLSASGLSRPTGLKTGCMKWYIFNDTEEAISVNMILGHDTTPNIEWVNSEDYAKATGQFSTTKSDKGPITLNKKLQQDITSWDDSVKSTTRLITADEVALITGNTSFDSKDASLWYYLDSNTQTQTLTSGEKSKYAWLFGYLLDCDDYGCDVPNFGGESWAIWTSSVAYSGSISAWVITYKGQLAEGWLIDGKHVGLRPVITVSKEIIS